MAQLESALFQLWHLVKELGLKMYKLIPRCSNKANQYGDFKDHALSGFSGCHGSAYIFVLPRTDVTETTKDLDFYGELVLLAFYAVVA